MYSIAICREEVAMIWCILVTRLYVYEYICMNIPRQMLKFLRSLPLSLPHSIPNSHVPTPPSLALHFLSLSRPVPTHTLLLLFLFLPLSPTQSPSPSPSRPSFFFYSSHSLFPSFHLSVPLSLRPSLFLSADSSTGAMCETAALS